MPNLLERARSMAGRIIEQAKTLWHRGRDRLLRARTFVIERVPVGEVFVIAHNVRATRDDRLVFTSWCGLVTVAVFASGQWNRVQRGVIAEDLKQQRGVGEQ